MKSINRQIYQSNSRCLRPGVSMWHVFNHSLPPGNRRGTQIHIYDLGEHRHSLICRMKIEKFRLDSFEIVVNSLMEGMDAIAS